MTATAETPPQYAADEALARLVAGDMLEGSARMAEGALKLVSAMCWLTTGRVRFPA